MPHAVPGVFAPKPTAAVVVAAAIVPASGDVVGKTAMLVEVTNKDGGEVVTGAVAGTVDEEASMLGQKVLLKPWISMPLRLSTNKCGRRAWRPTLDV